MDPGAPTPPEATPPAGTPPPEEGGQHDFEAQKRIHQQIRNDPDYDDWEYGTEPLPHEAWVPPTPAAEPAEGSAQEP